MFGSPNIQISYNARLRRARVEFKASECFKHRTPPLNQLAKIQKRFEQDREDGHIEDFALFTKRFEELWHYIRLNKATIEPQQNMRLTIGQGGRLYDEIVLTPAANADDLASFSCFFDQRRCQTIPFNSFVFNVILKLEKLKISRNPDRAQLRFLYLLLKNGKKLQDVSLKPQPDSYDQSLVVRVDQRHHYISLHLYDHRWLKTAENRAKIWKKAVIELNRLNTQKTPMTLLKEHSMEKIASLATKMQGIGFSMPYDLLIGYDASYRLDAGHLKAEKALAEHEQPHQQPWKIRIGAKHKGEYFQIEVADDGMIAKIAAVNAPALQKVKSSIDLEWLLRILAKQGIVHGCEPYVEGLWQAIQKDRSLVGKQVASGSAPVKGQTPMLHLIAADISDTKVQVDIRETQNRRLVKQDTLVAEIRFSDGQPGMSVTGEARHALGSAAALKAVAGDGIALLDDSRFYARRDGLLTLQGSTLVCETTLIHNGSINLSSGNLSFEGSVIVQGDIESGASVHVTGSLIVEGMIGPSIVKTTGDLQVKGGIVTGHAGMVQAGGKVQCNFIENSDLQVRGDVLVQRSILNSTVIAGGAIQILDSRRGIIAGGAISSWRAISTATCGMAEGAVTECRIGSDYRAELKLRRNKKRFLALKTYHAQLQKIVKDAEAHAHNPAQVANHEALKLRLQKAERIQQHLSQRCEQLEQKMQWNAQATLVVTGILDKRVNITAAGRKVAHTDNIEAVLVASSPFQGSHLVDLEEIAAFQKAYPDSQFATQKKAS